MTLKSVGLEKAMKKKTRKWLVTGALIAGSYAVMRGIAQKKKDPGDIDRENPYLDATDLQGEHTENSYVILVKPAIDRLFSFLGLVFLSPLLIGISIAIYLDDPGPIFFAQKRIGKDKKFFMLHKFRSMKMSTPHDVPTHMLENPEQYITRVGRFLRKSSLDELPQIWDIFRGKMSIIGPRPALWNQDDLARERDRYGANGVMPGLTGWAQINGRDELEIPDKAKLDGDYVKALRKGSLSGFLMDVKCLFGTVGSVLKSDGVVEGGTGEMKKTRSDEAGMREIKKSRFDAASTREKKKSWSAEKKGAGKKKAAQMVGKVREGVPEEDPETEWGFEKVFKIDRNAHRRILITGAGSFIGESFRKYAAEHYGASFTIDSLDMQDDHWRTYDFGGYDSVFHVAGIAHADVGNVDAATIEKYYKVNTDLAIETAEIAKKAGVRQLVFMSSMIIYGDSASYGEEKMIDRNTCPAPANFYGDSKWQADKGVRALADEDFRVCVLRPPMIYGRGSKGNYPLLAKLAKKLPVFPQAENQRSMLYIENLCEFLCKIMLSGEGGVYFPQNGEYSNTGELVKDIAAAAGKHMYLSWAMSMAVRLGSHMPGKIGSLVNKAFGNSCYAQELSEYEGLDYRKYNLKESIARTEGEREDAESEDDSSSILKKRDSEEETDPETAGRKIGEIHEDAPEKKHILLISQYFYPETFRVNDIAQEWVKRGYRVTVLTGIPNYPMGKFFEGYDYRHRRRETWNGVDIIRLPLVPRGNSDNKILNACGMIANYLSFVISGRIWVWRNSDIRADLVFTVEVSPMTQALIGVWYGKKHHVPSYLYVQDLWPENVETVTGIHNKLLIAPIDRMVDKIYRDTDMIFTTSPSFVEKIVNRDMKVRAEKVHYWPQYAEDFYEPLDRETVMETAGDTSPVYLIPDDDSFKIIFTGNIGTAQGLDILPRVAEKLEDADVRFVIVGDGRYQKNFEEEIERRGVKHKFTIIPRQPAEQIPALLACCDAAFLSFHDTELWRMTIPAKLQSYMACGMPVIAAAQGETERIIREADCGTCVPTGDSDALAETILRYMGNRDKSRGKNARAYFERHFAKKMLMDEMDGYLTEL